MTRRRCLSLFLSFLASTSCAASQMSTGSEIEPEVARLWDGRAFNELDKLEKSLRLQKSTSTSGWPLLFLFYQAVDSLPNLREGSVADLDKATADANKWLTESPPSDFAKFLKVDILIAHAWHARGYGYADTVSATQWKEFNAYMDKANEFLMKEKTGLSSNPNWYSVMLDIANLRSWPEPAYDALINEAVRRHGRYLPILTQAVFHFTPRWGGSYEKMDRFIESSTSALPSPEGDEIYAVQYSFAFENTLFPDRSHSSVSCIRWLRGYEGIMRKYATSYNLNHAAFAAVACGNKLVAARYFRQLGEQPPDSSVWGVGEQDPQAFYKARRWAVIEH